MFPTDIRFTQNAFITPFYTTFVDKGKHQKNFSEKELKSSYDSYLKIREGLEQLGYLSANDKDETFSLQFSIPESERATRRMRAIPLYSPDYVNFLQMDVRYRDRKFRVGQAEFYTSPILSYSCGLNTVGRFPFKNNSFFKQAAAHTDLDISDFARRQFTVEDTLHIMKSLRELIETEFVSRSYSMSHAHLSNFLACVVFLSSAQSAVKLHIVSEQKRKTLIDYLVEVISHDVAALKIMMVFSASNYSHDLLTNQEYLMPVITAEELMQYKDIPASFLQMLFISTVEAESEEDDVFKLLT